MFRKRSGALRFIQDFQDLNAVTIRDAGSVPRLEAFTNDIAGRCIYSVMDVKGGYDQLLLAVADRDYTGISISLGHFRLTMLPQGWTKQCRHFSACYDHCL